MPRDPDDGFETWGARQFKNRPTDEQLKKLQHELDKVPAAPPPQKPLSITDAAKSIKKEDFLHVYQYPCARQGFMAGIGGGAAVGAVRYILGGMWEDEQQSQRGEVSEILKANEPLLSDTGSVPKAANWVVGAFFLSSIISYEYCQARRTAEKERMRRVVEVYDRTKASLKQEMDEAKRKEEEAEAARLAVQKRHWYKLW